MRGVKSFLVSVKKDPLYPATMLRQPPPANSDDSGCDFSFIPLESFYEAAFVCELRRAFVSPGGVVFQNGFVLTESVYNLTRQVRNAPTFYKKILLGRVRRVPGLAFVMHNPYYTNYYHWTLEALPRIFVIRERIRNASLILGPMQRPFHEETLAFFQFPRTVRLALGEVAYSQQLLLPMHLCPFPQHNEKVIVQMGAWFRQNNKLDPARFSEYGNLYVQRGSDKLRRLVNEDEVIKLAEQFGFKCLRMEGMTVPEQIALFSNVKNLLAVHGAAASNMIYMQPGGVFFDLINEHHHDAAFHNLTCAFRHTSVIQQCRTVGDRDRAPKKYDIHVDIERLARNLERFMKS